MKRILVLSGGGSYGAFEAGIVANLIENNKGSWDFITGVSAGSLNASYLSTIDKDSEKDNIDRIKSFWFEIKNEDVFKDEFFLNGLSMYNSNKFKNKIQNVFKELSPKRPVLIGSTSLSKCKSQTFSNDDIIEHGFTEPIMCSVSIPIVFQPYSFLNDMFIDGGFTSNILFNEAVNYAIKNYPGEDIQIDVIVCGRQIKEEDVNKDNINLTKLLEKIANIAVQQVEYSEIINKVDVPIYINVVLYERKNETDISFLDFDKSEELWNQGYTMSNVNIINL